jgi:putative FmdB family regulatory protein
MPTYRYKCESCHEEQEIEQKISDAAITSCPVCKSETFKRIPPKEVAIQFKGSGFYINDYQDKPSKDDKNGGGCGRKGGCGCH